MIIIIELIIIIIVPASKMTTQFNLTQQKVNNITFIKIGCCATSDCKIEVNQISVVVVKVCPHTMPEGAALVSEAYQKMSSLVANFRPDLIQTCGKSTHTQCG